MGLTYNFTEKFTDSSIVGPTASNDKAHRISHIHVVSTTSKSAWASIHKDATTTAGNVEIFYYPTGIEGDATNSASNNDWIDLRVDGGCVLITGANFNYATITYTMEQK